MMPTRTRARGHVYLGDPSEYAEKLRMTPIGPDDFGAPCRRPQGGRLHPADVLRGRGVIARSAGSIGRLCGQAVRAIQKRRPAEARPAQPAEDREAARLFRASITGCRARSPASGSRRGDGPPPRHRAAGPQPWGWTSGTRAGAMPVNARDHAQHSLTWPPHILRRR